MGKELFEVIAEIDVAVKDDEPQWDGQDWADFLAGKFPRDSEYNATVRTGRYEQVSAPGVRPIEFRYRQNVD